MSICCSDTTRWQIHFRSPKSPLDNNCQKFRNCWLKFCFCRSSREWITLRGKEVRRVRIVGVLRFFRILKDWSRLLALTETEKEQLSSRALLQKMQISHTAPHDTASLLATQNWKWVFENGYHTLNHLVFYLSLFLKLKVIPGSRNIQFPVLCKYF